MSSLKVVLSAKNCIRSHPLLSPKNQYSGVSNHKTSLRSRKVKIVKYSVEEEKETEQIQTPIQNSSAEVQAEPQKQEEVKEEETLGIVGTSIMWALLIFLFAGSLFFTFGRSFQEDMQPLDPQTIIEMTS